MKVQMGKAVASFFNGRIPFALEESELNLLGEKITCLPVTTQLPNGSLRVKTRINGNDFYIDFNKSIGEYDSWIGSQWQEKIVIHASDEDYKKTAIEGICAGRAFFADSIHADEVHIYGVIENEGIILVHADYRRNVDNYCDIYVDYYDDAVLAFLEESGIRRQGGNCGLSKDFYAIAAFLKQNGITPDKTVEKSFGTTKDFKDILNEMNYGYRILEILIDLLNQEVKAVSHEDRKKAICPSKSSTNLHRELQKNLGNRFCQTFTEDALKELGDVGSVELGTENILGVNKRDEKICYIPEIGFSLDNNANSYIKAKGLRKKTANFTLDFYTNDTGLTCPNRKWKYNKAEDGIVIYDDTNNPKTFLKIIMSSDEKMHFNTVANGIVLSDDGKMYLITTTGFYNENKEAYNIYPTGDIVLQQFDANIVSFLQEQGIIMPQIKRRSMINLVDGYVIEEETDVKDMDFSKLTAAIKEYGLVPESECRWSNTDSSTARSTIVSIFSNIIRDGQSYCAKKCNNSTLARKNPNEA